MSKFKLVPSRKLPKGFLEYLDSEEFAIELLTRVLGHQLRVENPLNRPAEHYVQELDKSITVHGNVGIELTLSKVSVMDGRYFGGALDEMIAILTEAVKKFTPKGQEVQIFCVIATNIPVPGTDTTLFEMSDGVWVKGEAA